VQRLQRGGRLDPMNPSKRNNLFIWTEEWSRAVNSLTLMRQEDALFHKKLRTLSACYDRLGEPAVQRESRVRAEELQAYAEVRCLTLEEMFMKRVDELCAMRERLGRDPAKSSSDPEEKRQAYWLCRQRMDKKKNMLSADCVAILQAIPWWSWAPYDYGDSVAKFCAMRERLGRDPVRTSSDSEERRQAQWLSTQRMLKKRGDLPADRVAILQAIPWWSWVGRDYSNAVAEFSAMRERLGRDPRQISSDAEERRQGKWLNKQRDAKKNLALPADRVAMLQAIPGWSWGKRLKPRKNAT